MRATYLFVGTKKYTYTLPVPETTNLPLKNGGWDGKFSGILAASFREGAYKVAPASYKWSYNRNPINGLING